jgi:hypothetical protein
VKKAEIYQLYKMFAGIKASDSEMITNSAFTTCFLGFKALFIDVAKQCAKCKPITKDIKYTCFKKTMKIDVHI